MRKYSISGKSFVDKDGKEVILRGINMVCKEKDKGYIGDYSDKDFKNLAALGFNVVRFGLFWDAVEPAPGEYNDAYLEKIRDFSKMAEKYGIAFYLDMHQDLFSAEFCDGAPGWATLTNGESYEQTDLWSEAYLTCPAVQIAFDNFWNNEKLPDGTRVMDRFISMWEHLAEFFMEDENIIGADVFNEPFPGTVSNDLIGMLFEKLAIKLMSDVDLMIAILGEKAEQVNEENIAETIMGIWMDDEKKSKLLEAYSDKEAYRELVYPLGEMLREFDTAKLTNFYQRIRDAIRKKKSDWILFIEANYFCNTGVRSNVILPKDESGKNDSLLAYAPHGYDLMVDTQMYSSDCFSRIDVIFETHNEYGKANNIPVLAGEWGCYPNANEAQIKEAGHIISLFESFGFSNTYYDFSTFENNPIAQALKKRD